MNGRMPTEYELHGIPFPGSLKNTGMKNTKDMQPHQLRVAEEQKELCVKIIKLGGFMASQAFGNLSMAECKRLRRQYAVMREYCDILRERIEAF